MTLLESDKGRFPIVNSFLLMLGVAFAMPVALAQPARGDAAYPVRAVRLITPSSPGGGVDIVARLFAVKVNELESGR